MPRVVVCTTDELPTGTVRVFELGEVRVAVARSGDTVFALEDRCSHDDGEIGEGELVGETEIECPRHGGRFDMSSGRATRMPAIAPVERFEAGIDNGSVWVEEPEW